MEDKDNDYLSFPHEEWWDLMSIVEAKDNKNRAASQIKRLAASKAALSNSGRDTSKKDPNKNKARNFVLFPTSIRVIKPPSIKVLIITV